MIRGEISFELFTPGLHLVPLTFNGVGIRLVTLNDKATPLAHDAKLGVVLPVEGVGRHTLQVELTAPLVTTAARQTLQLELPTAPASTFHVSVAGNVEIKSGAAIVRREVDEQKNVTQLDLALNPGPLALAFSLNNKQLAKDRIVIARGVLVDEVTSAYERLHATVSLIVLHGSLPETKLAMPTGFEVTSVHSPHVSRWEMKGDDLVVTFREAVVEPVTLELTATRYGPPPAGWKFPRLAPRDVASQAFVLGVAVEDRWEIRQVVPEGLIPIDTAVLTNAMPESVFAPGAGLPGIRPVVAYYAPHELYGLSASINCLRHRSKPFPPPFSLLARRANALKLGLLCVHAVRNDFTWNYSCPQTGN